MLPTQIELRNFTSYQDEVADISGISIASIVGLNGSGKSSLLDALLFGLFGEATKGGQKQLDNYVQRGCADGSVCINFTLHGQKYRVERSRNVAKNKSALRLLRHEKGEEADFGGWSDIGGKNITEVQTAIEKLLRMDYRTFSASSLILQGKSDSLTADMTDSERKDVLARILGLDIWDVLQERAKERVRNLKAEIQASDQARSRYAEEAKQKPALLKKQISVEADLTELEPKIATLEAEITDLSGKMAQRPHIEKQIADLGRQVEAHKKTIVDNGTTRGDHKKAIAHAEQKIAEAQSILAHKEQIEKAITDEQMLAEELAGQEQKAKQYQDLLKAQSNLKSQSSSWESDHQSKLAKLSTSTKNAREQSALLGEVPCQGSELAEQCKLLASARKAAELLAEYEKSLNVLQSQKNPHAEKMQTFETEITQLQYDSEEHDGVRSALTDVRKTAGKKGALDNALSTKEMLEEKITENAQAIVMLEQKIVELNAEIDKLTAEKTPLQNQLNELSPISWSLTEKQGELAKLKRKDQELRPEQGRITAALEQIEKAEREIEKIDTATQGAKDKIFSFELLDQACSKRGGVPALIIENAVPQIEKLANDLLSQMAEGSFQVRLDTQAEGKSTGKMQEVLRIIILDQGNERQYQTYSGAEKFMVDLALRIGISKFLTQRAGAEIQLLVIDEGMGSLDQANRLAVVDAIRTASEYFGRVLLITHIAELQDAFPQRIEVSKNSHGSKVKVIA